MAENENITLCACGCGQPILWVLYKRDPNRKKPRFISGHNCRVMKTKRPDPPPPNSSGLCQCGCCGVTPLATQTSRVNVAGEHIRYIKGHAPIWESRRNPLSPDDPKGPNPSGKCCCGCGGAVPVADRHNTITGNIAGCYVKFLRGHCHWKNRPAGTEQRTGICGCGCGLPTPLATRSARGNVRGVPMLYFDQSHAQRETYTEDPLTGCWLMNPGPDGYTRVHRGGKLYLGHTWHWEQEHGALPEGVELDHLCRNRCCVRPLHLEPVNHEENMHRIAQSNEFPDWKDLQYEINPDTGCWIVTTPMPRKYAWVWVDGRLIVAHRFFYCQSGKPAIPDGYELDHTCCQPLCICTNHLEPVTKEENTRRAAMRREQKRIAA